MHKVCRCPQITIHVHILWQSRITWIAHDRCRLNHLVLNLLEVNHVSLRRVHNAQSLSNHETFCRQITIYVYILWHFTNHVDRAEYSPSQITRLSLVPFRVRFFFFFFFFFFWGGGGENQIRILRLFGEIQKMDHESNRNPDFWDSPLDHLFIYLFIFYLFFFFAKVFKKRYFDKQNLRDKNYTEKVLYNYSNYKNLSYSCHHSIMWIYSK